MGVYFIHAFEECLFRAFMKIFCKKVWILGLFCILWTSFLTSCSESVEADDEITLNPDVTRTITYKLYPNDYAKNDSAAANLARGVMLVVHPEAAYTLSFDVDSTQPAPELQLFRTFEAKGREGYVRFKKVRTLAPKIVGNRYVYSFVCHENKMNIWATSLGVNGQYYKGTVKNVSLTGTGAYSDHFSINLIVTGAMEKTYDGMDVEELSRYMLKIFREKYQKYSNVFIDTLYVRYAHEHPTLGDKYPADVPWVAGESSDDVFLSELSSWPEEELRYTLNIVLVHSIGENDIMGFSRLFSGVLGAGEEGTVVIGEHVRKSSGSLELLSSSNIVMTAVHETGHFFGLRHTSTTRRDLGLFSGSGATSGDLSNLDDGLTDTDFCEYILRSGLYKEAGDRDMVYREYLGTLASESAGYLAKSSILSCPDLDNIMFPVTVDDGLNATFSKQQMEIVRSSLTILPH